MVPLATSPRRTDGRPAVPWSWKTTGFATALGGRAQPVVFHDQSVGIAARHKTPKRSAHPSRLDENAFFLLTKKTPYKGWGEGRGDYGAPHPALRATFSRNGGRTDRATAPLLLTPIVHPPVRAAMRGCNGTA